MSNDNIKILEFLDLNCNDLELIDIEIKDSSLKVVTVAKLPSALFAALECIQKVFSTQSKPFNFTGWFHCTGSCKSTQVDMPEQKLPA